MQAKDLDDRRVLSAVFACTQYGNGGWVRLPAMLFDIEKTFPLAHFKVVRAKMRSLIKRGLIDGCPCGCRGDFVLLPKGEALLREAA